jgi:hypothetical protein
MAFPAVITLKDLVLLLAEQFMAIGAIKRNPIILVSY